MSVTLETLTIPCPACYTPYDCSNMETSGPIGSGHCQQCHTNLVFVESQRKGTQKNASRHKTWYQSLWTIAMMPVDRSFRIPGLLLGLFFFNFLILTLAFSMFYLPAIRTYDPYDLDAYYLTPVLLRINGWSSLHFAAARGDLQTVQELVNEDSDPYEKNYRGRTPLFEAAKRGREEVVGFFLNLGVHPDEKDLRGRTALFDSVRYNHTSTTNLLLTAGSSIHVQDKQTGNSLLHIAVRYGHVQMVQLLTQRNIDPNATNKKWDTPLHQLARADWIDDTEIASLLIQAGADLEAKSALGYTPLLRAARDGNVALVTFLIEQGGSMENQTVEGSTALSLAAYSGNIEAVKVLIQHGAVINTRRLNGWMPIHRAASRGHVEVVEILIQHHAELNARVWGQTPLHLAEKGKHKDVADLLRKYGGITNQNIYNHIRNAYNFEKQKDCKQALAEYEQGLLLAPDDPELLTRQSHCLVSNGEHRQALRSLKKVLAIHPTYFHAIRQQTYILRIEGRYQEALAAWNRLLFVQPFQARAYFERSYIYGAIGLETPELKAQAFQQALEDLQSSCRLGYENGCKAYEHAPWKQIS